MTPPDPETSSFTASGSPLPDRPHSLIAASRVAGTAVFNTAGERLGAVEDVMLDKQSGRVVYALLSFGGFLGFGGKHHPLPWNALRYDVSSGGYVIDLDPTRLEGAPVLDEGSYDLADERAWAQRVDDYWKISPYWSQVP